jgi:hypothetical protein
MHDELLTKAAQTAAMLESDLVDLRRNTANPAEAILVGDLLESASNIAARLQCLAAAVAVRAGK